MVQIRIHFNQDQVAVEFESDFAFTKWLGYLKEHGLATVKMAGQDRSVIVFRDSITYIETEGDARAMGLH